MPGVFVVQHLYPTRTDDDEAKFIGVFKTRGDARTAIRRLRKQPGFIDSPRDFYVDKYTLNECSWQEGFVTMLKGKRAAVVRAKSRKRI
jgi:hypothetical protein